MQVMREDHEGMIRDLMDKGGLSLYLRKRLPHNSGHMKVEAFTEFLRSMLQRDQEARPSTTELLRSRYLADI